MAAGTGDAARRRAAFRDGVRDYLSTAPGIAAWGLVTGVAMIQSGLGLAESVGLSVLAFAGSAQLAALPLLLGGAPVGVIVATALLVNLRFLIYGAALRGHLGHLPFARRVAYGYMTGDVGFVLFMRRMRHRPDWPERGSYFAGLGVANAVVWHGSSLAGIFAAASFPREWGLELAGTLALLALLLPQLAAVPAASGALAAAAIGVATLDWPFRLGILVAILGGLGVALAAERATRARAAAP